VLIAIVASTLLVGNTLSLYFVLVAVLLGYLSFSVVSRSHRWVAHSFDLKGLISLSIAALVSGLCVGVVAVSQPDISTKVATVYFFVMSALSGFIRVLAMVLFAPTKKGASEPVIVFGAGTSGQQLVSSLAARSQYHVVGFVDNDESLNGMLVKGVRVYRPDSIASIVDRYNVKVILLAVPSATKAQRREMLLSLEMLPVKVMTIPGLHDLVSGSHTFSDIQEVDVDDLLGREVVAPKAELIGANVTDKIVMVTGAGGSIGSELCRQILRLKPTKLVLFEISEFGLYAIERELSLLKRSLNLDIEVLPVMGSIQNKSRLLTVIKRFSVQTIYHAAAYKHVPLVEMNVIEGVRNNVFGTLNAAEAAKECNVETFVLVSTDKAVRPTNVMGTTKRCAELVLQALSQEPGNTRYCMVRFGNVLGSSGSVVPVFRSQIAAGGPVTVTHPEITRFFMTIPEAAQLVLQAGAMGQGGDVFVLDMGQSVRISDLAERMIRLSGKSIKSEDNPNGDVEVVYSGLRPGEKLYEELLIGDNVRGTSHERIMAADEVSLSPTQLAEFVSKLDEACRQRCHESIRRLLLEAPTGFAPVDGIGDLLHDKEVEIAAKKPLVGDNIVQLNA